MCLTVGEYNSKDFLMVDKNVFTESEEINLQNDFKIIHLKTMKMKTKEVLPEGYIVKNIQRCIY
jgi:hypothetical protein